MFCISLHINGPILFCWCSEFICRGVMETIIFLKASDACYLQRLVKSPRYLLSISKPNIYWHAFQHLFLHFHNSSYIASLYRTLYISFDVNMTCFFVSYCSYISFGWWILLDGNQHSGYFDSDIIVSNKSKLEQRCVIGPIE